MYKIRFVFGENIGSEAVFNNKQERDDVFNDLKKLDFSCIGAYMSNNAIIILRNVLYIEKIDD